MEDNEKKPRYRLGQSARIIFTMLALKSQECGKGASYYGQAEKPAQTLVYGERNAEWEADYYHTRWIVNTMLGP